MMKRKTYFAALLTLVMVFALFFPATAVLGVGDDGSPETEGELALNKKVTEKEDGTYTIELEAFATGDTIITEITKDVPTDIVLVLDQSGSMKEPIGSSTFEQYLWYGQNPTNGQHYENRHNGGAHNLYHYLEEEGVYVTVNVTKDAPESAYTSFEGENFWYYYYNQDRIFYRASDGEYKKIRVEERPGFLIPRYYIYVENVDSPVAFGPGYIIPDLGSYAPFYLRDESQVAYNYWYYDAKGKVHEITSSVGEDTVLETPLYRKIVDPSGGVSRLEALKTALTSFTNSVAAKAMGEDGVPGGNDDVNHRIAFVGFASGDYPTHIGWGETISQHYYNTEIFIGENGYAYPDEASSQYGQAFQDMNTATGQANAAASIGALDTLGATAVDLGVEMANGILAANPVEADETRNRVVIVFTDGVPGRQSFEASVANAAIAKGRTTKTTHKATLYTIGIFPGADATSEGNQSSNNAEQKANWFMQNLSSNNGTPQMPSYYLSASDAYVLNQIFEQISSQIETGGSTTTLGAETVIRDALTPQFQFPEGAQITLESYKCTGVEPYTWEKNPTALGAEAVINGSTVDITGFDFAANYVGTVENAETGQTEPRGNKLVIRFDIELNDGFIGGNNVYTNKYTSGIYANADAANAPNPTPLQPFEQPQVNVPMKPLHVLPAPKNVYLHGDIREADLPPNSYAWFGPALGEDESIPTGNDRILLDLSPDTLYFGLNEWQLAYVDLDIAFKNAEGTEPFPGYTKMTEDERYSLWVNVAPLTDGTGAVGTPAVAQEAHDGAPINVFLPNLTFEDGYADYGADVPDEGELENNLVGQNPKWKHNGIDSTAVWPPLIGEEPELMIAYTPVETKDINGVPTTYIQNGKVVTKDDIDVHVTTKIGTDDVTSFTSFHHEDCDPACSWNQLDPAPVNGKPAFLLHVHTFELTIKKTGGDANDTYVIELQRDGKKYTELSITGNDSVTIKELPVGSYTIKENEGWSWRYNANNGEAVVLGGLNDAGSITCENTKNNDKWLNHFADVVANVFRREEPPQPPVTEPSVTEPQPVPVP